MAYDKETAIATYRDCLDILRNKRDIVALEWRKDEQSVAYYRTLDCAILMIKDELTKLGVKETL